MGSSVRNLLLGDLVHPGVRVSSSGLRSRGTTSLTAGRVSTSGKSNDREVVGTGERRIEQTPHYKGVRHGHESHTMNMIGPSSCQRHTHQYRPSHELCRYDPRYRTAAHNHPAAARYSPWAYTCSAHDLENVGPHYSNGDSTVCHISSDCDNCSRFPSRHHQCGSSLNHLAGPVMMSFVILVVMVVVVLAQQCDPSQSLILACIRSSSPAFGSRPQVHPSLIFDSAKQEMLSVTKPPSACFWRLPSFGRHLPQLRHCALTWVEPSPPLTPIAAVALPSRIHHRSAPLPTCTYLSEVIARVLALFPLSLGLGIL